MEVVNYKVKRQLPDGFVYLTRKAKTAARDDEQVRKEKIIIYGYTVS